MVNLDNTVPPSPTGWPLHRTMVVLAGAFIALSGILVYTPPLDEVVLVFLGPGTLAALALAITARRWFYPVAGTLILLPGLMVVFLFGEIRYVADPFIGGIGDYLSILLLFGATLLVIPGAIMGFLATPGLSSAPKNPYSWLRSAFAIAVIALLGGMGVGTAFAHAAAPAAVRSYDVQPDHSVTLQIFETGFESNILLLRPDELTEIVVTNLDTDVHTFTYQVNDNVFSHRVRGDETIRFLTRLEPGTYDFWCEPHKDTMKGTLLVEAL